MASHQLIKADLVMANIFDDLSARKYQAAPNIQIKQVVNEHDLLEFDKIARVAFAHPEKMAFNFLKNALSSPNIYFFLASIDNNIAGCGMVYLGDLAGLYWDGVLPEFRRKGVGTALTTYRMNFIKNKGFNSVCAQNMTPSAGYYKDIGFKSVGELPLYIFTGE
jgi:hypothetical protein